MTRYKFFTLFSTFPEIDASEETSEDRLNKLLDEGWRPVRETELDGASFPGSNANVPGSRTTGIGHVFAALVLLEKDEE